MRKEFFIMHSPIGTMVFVPMEAVVWMQEGSTCSHWTQIPHTDDNPNNNPLAKVLRDNCSWGSAERRYGASPNQWVGYEFSIGFSGETQVSVVKETLLGLGFEEVFEPPWGVSLLMA